MNDSVTISRDSFFHLMELLFKDTLIELAWRYIRLRKEIVLELMPEIIEEFYVRISNGEAHLLKDPKRNIERIGVRHMVKYIRSEIPMLNI